LRYLKSTSGYELVYEKSGKGIEGYVDADWAVDSTSRCSCTGFAMKLSNGAVSWEYRRQRTVASQQLKQNIWQ
jgi:hypothetical protein